MNKVIQYHDKTVFMRYFYKPTRLSVIYIPEYDVKVTSYKQLEGLIKTSKHVIDHCSHTSVNHLILDDEDYSYDLTSYDWRMVLAEIPELVTVCNWDVVTSLDAVYMLLSRPKLLKYIPLSGFKYYELQRLLTLAPKYYKYTKYTLSHYT